MNYKNTKKINSDFNKASKAEKRVMIAEDVLKQLKAAKYVAKQGSWVSFDYYALKDLDPDLSLKDAFLSNEIGSCEVCGVGSLMMSCVNLNNNVTLKEAGLGNDSNSTVCNNVDYENNTKILKQLRKYFTQNQIILIELAFEAGHGYYDVVDGGKMGRKAADFFSSLFFSSLISRSEQKLEMIMNNIIENKGTFRP